MSTIELSSEDEDECIILDSDEQVNFQPPHCVFLPEDKLNSNLLKEDESEDNEDTHHDENCRSELDKIFLESLSSPLSEITFDIKESDLCRLNDFNPNDGKDVVKTPVEDPIKQDNNVIFQKLAEALTTALSSSFDGTQEKSLEKEQDDGEPVPKEKVNNPIINKKKVTEDNEHFSQVNTNNNNDATGLSISNSLGNSTPNVKKRGRKPGWRKTPTNFSLKDVPLDISTLSQKMCGRKPSMQKTLPTIELISSLDTTLPHNSLPNKKKRGRKRGWRKSLATVPWQENISTPNAKTNVQKPENKPNQKGITKHIFIINTQDHTKQANITSTSLHEGTLYNSIESLEPNPIKDKTPLNNSVLNKKKRGRKIGWRKFPTTMSCQENVSKPNTKPNVQKLENKSNRKSVPKQISFSNTQDHTNQTNITNKFLQEVTPYDSTEPLEPNAIIDKTPLNNCVPNKKKCGRKLGWKKSPATISCETQDHANQSTTKSKCQEEVSSHNIKNTNSKRNKTTPHKKTNLPSKSENIYDNNATFTNLKGSEEKDVNVIQKLMTWSSTPDYKDPDTQKGICFQNSTCMDNISKSIANKFLEDNQSLNVQSRLTGDVNQDQAVLKEDFVKCYNKIFNNNTEMLSIRLGDILLLTIKEIKQFINRTNAATKLTCELLRDKELYHTTNSFKINLDNYRKSFCPVFHDILLHILSNKEAVYQHKALLLALFIKVFVRITTLSPEFSHSLILAKNAIKALLMKYLTAVQQPISTIVYDTFWQGDTDFERNCWFILDFSVESLSKSSDFSNDSLDKSGTVTNFETVNKCLNSKFGTQMSIIKKSTEVSVIVRNQNHKEQCTLTVKNENSSNICPEHDIINNLNLSVSHPESNNILSTNSSINETAENASNNTVNVKRVSLDKGNINPINYENWSCPNRLIEVGSSLLPHNQGQINQELSRFNAQTMKEGNANKDKAGVKRKAFNWEDSAIKPSKTAGIQPSSNLQTNCRQSTPMNIQAKPFTSFLQDKASNNSFENPLNRVGLQTSFDQAKPNAESRNNFPPSVYGCEKTNFSVTQNPLPRNFSAERTEEKTPPCTSVQNLDPIKSYLPSFYGYARTNFGVTSNSVLNMSSMEPSVEKFPSYYQNVPPAYGPENYKQFEQHPMNLSTTHTSYMGSGTNKQRYTSHSTSQLSVHQAPGHNSEHGNILNSYEYLRNTSPHSVSHTKAPINYYLQNQQNSAISHSQHPHVYTPTYGYNPYRSDPRLDIHSMNQPGLKDNLVINTNKVTPNMYPLTLPQQMKNIRSNCGITINNYNYNTYVPTKLTESTCNGSSVNSDQYSPY